MPHCSTLLYSSLLATQDSRRTVIENAGLAVQDGYIAAVGPRKEFSDWTADVTINLGDALLLPGLINGHTHAAMTIMRGFADDLPLMQWLNGHVFPVEARLTRELVRLGTLQGYAEMLATGTTACIDMYLFEEAVLEAAIDAGIRCMGGEAVFEFPSPACADYVTALAHTKELAQEYRRHPLVKVAVNPHSVYTTTPDILAACRDLAVEEGLPLHMHLAETPEETAKCIELHGCRPLAHCLDLGLLDVRCVLAHVVDVNPDDLEELASSPAMVVHNPTSNMKLASGAAPIPAMQECGIAVCLGTDGPASNNRLNMYSEMNRAALLHKMVGGDPSLLPAQKAFDMATIWGARAMGDEHLGRLVPGAHADCTALRLDAPHMQPLYDVASHVVYAATGLETCLTMVNGEVLYRNGKFTELDYESIREEIEDITDFVRRVVD
jgi:5-methylthioadenosine/S-adenosylhomocysteine deaminase